MKKLLSVVLVLVMLGSLSLGVFAAREDQLTDEEKLVKLAEYEERITWRDALADEYEALKAVKETIKGQNEAIRGYVSEAKAKQKEDRKNKEWDALRSYLSYKRTHIELRISIKQKCLDLIDAQLTLVDACEAQDVEAAEAALETMIAVNQSISDINEQIIANILAYLSE